MVKSKMIDVPKYLWLFGLIYLADMNSAFLVRCIHGKIEILEDPSRVIDVTRGFTKSLESGSDETMYKRSFIFLLNRRGSGGAP